MQASDILDYFPSGKTPRPAQAALLEQLEAGWRVHDVFVLACPPASGKTEMAVTIAAWQAAHGVTCGYLHPDNVLLEQAADRYPEMTALYRQDMYECQGAGEACAPGHRAAGTCTGRCPYQTAKQAAHDSRNRTMNTHVYRAHRLYSPTVIFDEAHKLRDLAGSCWPVVFKKTQWRYPLDLRTPLDIIAWGQEMLRRDPDNDKLRRLVDGVSRVRSHAQVTYHPDRLEVRPSIEHFVGGRLWPVSVVQKIVLLSGTIGCKDIEELGLASRRVLYLECESPIPVQQRPMIYERAFNMSAQCAVHALPILAARLQALLLREPGKGLVHLPYALAEKLRDIVDHPRLLFHGRDDKKDVLEAYAALPPESGAVLIASGLYEGIDLPFDDDAWQVIAKVPWPSLGDADIRQKLAADPTWYDWQTIKLLVQAYGRLPRRPDGIGRTYVWDLTFEKLVSADRRRAVPLFPKHVRDAMGVLA